jgi:hypothetical protein
MPCFDIGPEETGRIVTADTERGLGQIVGAEGEELGFLGDLASHERGARQLDHRADEVFERAALFGEHGLCGAIDKGAQDEQLAPGGDERDHHFGNHRFARLFSHVAGSLENRAGLHLVDFGESDAEAATAVAKHRVELVQLARARRMSVIDTETSRLPTVPRTPLRRAGGTRGAADRAGGS